MSAAEDDYKQQLKDRRKTAYKKLMKRKQIAKRVRISLLRRNNAEKRFRFYGMMSVGVCTLFLILLFYNIISTGYTAFVKTEINIPVTLNAEVIEQGLYSKIIKAGLAEKFPEVTGRGALRALSALVSSGATYELEELIQEQPELVGTTQSIWLTASSDMDMYVKHALDHKDKNFSRLNAQQQEWVNYLSDTKNIRTSWNWDFFTHGDSREPELAGVLGAMIGSFFVIMSCMLVAFPLGVLTAIYLEEFATKNRFTTLIEVNINNLAAVPSIIFGLLGLTLYIQWLGIPRSASLAGGLTLALMALPVMVIATRTSIRAIPQSIRDGAMALGASKLQTTMHHVLPLAVPGIMTGTILSIARVLGETAPLLMIGMVAFVVDIPKHFFSASTALPVQIYLWADSAEPGFTEKTSATIMVLLGLLVLTNSLAVILRKKYEIRW